MRTVLLSVLAPLLVLVPAAASAVSPDAAALDEASWLGRLIPLPKQIRVASAITVPTSGIVVRTRDGAGELERRAAGQLTDVIRRRGRSEAGQARFEILVGVCDADGRVGDIEVPGARRLAGLPNREQAYVIEPVGDDRLVLAALDERGVFYAAQTFRQLLEYGIRGPRATIPIVRVLDWPDLSERGEWGGSAARDIEWMAERKMNLVEVHANLNVTPDGRGVAQADPELLRRGRLNALKVVPIITHLDQISETGIYDIFPELKGKGESAQHKTFPDEVAPCFSQPKMAEIIADWIGSLGAQEGVTDVCAWLSEEPLQCGCEECRKVGQYVLEARALVAGWRLAVKDHPNVRLRILLTQGSYATNDKVLAEVPPEVGVTYYHGGLTYSSSRDPMIYPLLEAYAAKGRWLGCYPQLDASWRIVCPWSGPQFVKYRMTEFVDKGLRCLCGYATPDNRLYDFNVTAAAEWSWNAHGRDEHEFAEAWATQEHIRNPAKAADWAVMLGAVGWDVYGSGVPYPYFFGSAAGLVQNKTKPALGESMFRYFPTEQHFAVDLAICDRALAIAQELREPKLIAETQVIGGYVAMLQAIYDMAVTLSTPGDVSAEARRSLQDAMSRLAEATAQTTSGLDTWKKACVGSEGFDRFDDTAQVTDQTAADIGKALAAFGVEDPGRAWRPTEVGTWKSDDFEQNESVRKTWEVTELIAGQGTYQVRFRYTAGWWGLNILRVALVSAPKDDPGKLTELSADEHEGVAAYENRANVYSVKLDQHNPNLRYFLVADIKGTRSGDKPDDRKGCEGAVTVSRTHPE